MRLSIGWASACAGLLVLLGAPVRAEDGPAKRFAAEAEADAQPKSRGAKAAGGEDGEAAGHEHGETTADSSGAAAVTSAGAAAATSAGAPAVTPAGAAPVKPADAPTVARPSDEAAPPPDEEDGDDTGDRAVSERAAKRYLLLVPIKLDQGIDPALAELTFSWLREAGEAAGYRLLGARQAQEASAPAELWALAYEQGADRAISAEVRAKEGRYLFTVWVASLDGQGPLQASGQATAAELPTVFSDLARAVLPLATSWWGPDTAPREREARLALRRLHASALDAPRLTPPPKAPAPKVEDTRWRKRRVHLALLSESAIGLAESRGYQHFLGLRADFRLAKPWLVGAGLAYANLSGRLDRESNLATWAQVEYRIFFTDRSDVSLPIRLNGGYIPNNGPYARASLGINVPFAERFEWALDALAPAVYGVPSDIVVSMNVSTELVIRF